MSTKRLPNMSIVEIALLLSLYLLLLLGVFYCIFINVEKGDEVIEFLKLVEKHEHLRDWEPPIDIVRCERLNGSNFDYREWVGVDTVLSLNN